MRLKRRICLVLAMAFALSLIVGLALLTAAAQSVTLLQSDMVTALQEANGQAQAFDGGTYRAYYGIPGATEIQPMTMDNDNEEGMFVWNSANENAYVKGNGFNVNFAVEKGYKESQEAWNMFAKSHTMAMLGFDITRDANFSIGHEAGTSDPTGLHGYFYYIVERGGAYILAARKAADQQNYAADDYADSFNVLAGDRVFVAFTSSNEYTCYYNIEFAFTISDPVSGDDLKALQNGSSFGQVITEGAGYAVLADKAVIEVADYNGGVPRYLIARPNGIWARHDNTDADGYTGDADWSAGPGDYVMYDGSKGEMAIGPNRGILIRATMTEDGSLTIGNEAFIHTGHLDLSLRIWIEKDGLADVRLDRTFKDLRQFAENPEADSNVSFSQDALAVECGNLSAGDVVNILYRTNGYKNYSQYDPTFTFAEVNEEFVQELKADAMLSANAINENRGGTSYYADYRFAIGTILSNEPFAQFSSQKVGDQSADVSTWDGEFYITPWEMRVENSSQKVMIVLTARLDCSLTIAQDAIAKVTEDYKDLRIDVVVKSGSVYKTYTSQYRSMFRDAAANEFVPGTFNLQEGDEVYFVYSTAKYGNGAIPVPSFKFGPVVENSAQPDVDANVIMLDTKLNGGQKTAFAYGSAQFLTGTVEDPIAFDAFDTPFAWNTDIHDTMYVQALRTGTTQQTSGPYAFGQELFSESHDYEFIYKIEIEKDAYLDITHEAFAGSQYYAYNRVKIVLQRTVGDETIYITKSDKQRASRSGSSLTSELQEANSLTAAVGNVRAGDVVYVSVYTPDNEPWPVCIDMFNPVFTFGQVRTDLAETITQSEVLSYLAASEGAPVTQLSALVDVHYYSGNADAGIRNNFNVFNKTEANEDTTESNASYRKGSEGESPWYSARISPSKVFSFYGNDAIMQYTAKQDGVRVRLSHGAIGKWNWGGGYSGIKVSVRRSGETSLTQLSDKTTLMGSVPADYYFSDLPDDLILNEEDELYVSYYVTSIGNYAELWLNVTAVFGVDLSAFDRSRDIETSEMVAGETNPFAEVELLEGDYPSQLQANTDTFADDGIALSADSDAVIRLTAKQNVCVRIDEQAAGLSILAYRNGEAVSGIVVHAAAGDVVEFVLNSSSLSRIAPIVVRFDANAYDYTKHDSVSSESIDAAEMYSRIYLPQASGKDTVLASFDLLNGKVNDPSVTREYENNRDFDVLVGQDAFASMRLVTESGDFSLRMAAHMDYDAIVKFTVKQNSVVSITHPAAGFDVWAFDTRGIKIVAEDAEGTRVTLLNKKILQSELTDSRYAADQYGLSGIHLAAGDTLYFVYYSETTSSSEMNINPTFHIETAGYDETKRPDFASVKLLDPLREQAIADIEGHFANFAEEDYSAYDWMEMTRLVHQAVVTMGDLLTEEDIVAQRDGTIAALDAYQTTEEQEAALNTYKAQKEAELTALFEGLNEGDYSEENWAKIRTAYENGLTLIRNATTQSRVDTQFEAAKTVLESVEKDGGTSGGCSGCSGGLHAVGLLGCSSAFVAAAAVLVLLRRKQR